MLNNLKRKIQIWNRERVERRRQQRDAKSAYEHVLGVLGIMKNEAMNIDEWVQHYISMGAGKIFLIDNGSTDETISKAQVWIDKGVVELIELPGRHQQKKHYWTAFKAFRIAKRCQWLLVADLDEFWFCPSGDSIAAQLSNFRAFDVIYANWRNFGNNGVEDHPASIRQAFTLAAPELYFHTERKYICRTSVIKSRQSLEIHQVAGARSERTISDNETFHLNHYVVQSMEFFRKVKMTRGNASTATAASVRDMTYFQKFDTPCTMPDHVLANLVASGKIK
ncbi:glycosyltransferase family 2 protein [Cypionkella sinensis]|uniref:Glycosyltransferase family 2 protein n=1 Tax=Cypionkella sinensis TaxID=1756043 RepID=A0ABV7IUP4_9RHOB